MKIWRFYLKPKKNDSNERYNLYAITNNKKYANYFMNTRNMDRFFVKCTKEDKETYSNFANDNRSNVLDEFELVCRHIGNDKLLCHKRIKVVITFYEYQCVNGDEFQCEITSSPDWWIRAGDYKKFNNKLKNALRILEYINSYKIYSMPFGSLDEEDDDYSAPDIWIDELGALISLFGDTFK